MKKIPKRKYPATFIHNLNPLRCLKSGQNSSCSTKNKEFCFWGYETNVYFISPDPQTWEEITLPEGRKPFPGANGWAVTLHPAETGMIYKAESTHSLAIKTVASRLPSWVKHWKDTGVNQSPELKAEDWKCLSFFRHCEKIALPLPACFVLLWCLPVLPREVSCQGDPCSWPAAAFFPTNNRWKKPDKNQGPDSPLRQKPWQRKWGFGEPQMLNNKVLWPLAPEPDWLQVQPGQSKSCALPCPLAELRIAFKPVIPDFTGQEPLQRLCWWSF